MPSSRTSSGKRRDGVAERRTRPSAGSSRSRARGSGASPSRSSPRRAGRPGGGSGWTARAYCPSKWVTANVCRPAVTVLTRPSGSSSGAATRCQVRALDSAFGSAGSCMTVVSPLVSLPLQPGRRQLPAQQLQETPPKTKEKKDPPGNHRKGQSQAARKDLSATEGAVAARAGAGGRNEARRPRTPSAHPLKCSGLGAVTGACRPGAP